MSRHSWTAGRLPREQASAKVASLSEKRFEELLKSASSFFAEAEGHTEEERQAVIVEIIATMDAYGLTVEDLR
jgi:uncharacterized protein YdaU (DUF1376 family)